MGKKSVNQLTPQATLRHTNVADLLDDGVENGSDLRADSSPVTEMVALPEIVPDGLKQDRYHHVRPLGAYNPRFVPSTGQMVHGKFSSIKVRRWLWIKAATLLLFVWIPASYASYTLFSTNHDLFSRTLSVTIFLLVSLFVFYEPYVMLRGPKEQDFEPFDGG